MLLGSRNRAISRSVNSQHNSVLAPEGTDIAKLIQWWKQRRARRRAVRGVPPWARDTEKPRQPGDKW
jgi:hypothetical protein